MESLDRLHAFRAVAHEGSFTQGARQIFRTQPAVSQAINALETELGEKLFLREGRSVVLTKAGELLLEEVDAAFASFERAEAKIAALRELETGELTIATSDTTACYVLPNALRDFRRRYPGIEIKVLNRPSPTAAALVREHRADLAVVTLPLQAPSLEVEELAPQEDVAIFAPDHPLAGRKRVKLLELLKYPLLLLDRGSSTRTFIDEKIAETSCAVNIAMELGSIEVIKRLVALDFGVSIVPSVSVIPELERGELASARVFKQSESRYLGIAFPTGGLSPAARVFVETLRESLGDVAR